MKCNSMASRNQTNSNQQPNCLKFGGTFLLHKVEDKLEIGRSRIQGGSPNNKGIVVDKITWACRFKMNVNFIESQCHCLGTNLDIFIDPSNTLLYMYNIYTCICPTNYKDIFIWWGQLWHSIQASQMQRKCCPWQMVKARHTPFWARPDTFTNDKGSL